jgi:hypothetical protein
MRIRSVQVEDIAATPLWDGCGYFLDEIAVGIDDAEAFATLKILANHRLKGGRLPGAGLSDEIHVEEPIGLLDAEHGRPVAEADAGEVGDWWG